MTKDACVPFRERMLEADPEELRGEGDGPLARHLRACPACARVASVLLEETGRLDAFLAAAPALDVEAVLAKAGIESGRGPGTAGASSPRSSGPRFAPRMRRFPTRRLWIPVAAAAALALLLFRSSTVHVPPTSVAAAVHAPAPPVVEPTAGQDAAIIKTDDPEITVVWLFTTG